MKKNRHLFFSPALCTGCRLCELVCSQINTGEYNPDRSIIKILSHPDLGSNIVTLYKRSCKCANGSEECTAICNVGAIRFVDDEYIPIKLKEETWLAAPILD